MPRCKIPAQMFFPLREKRRRMFRIAVIPAGTLDNWIFRRPKTFCNKIRSFSYNSTDLSAGDNLYTGALPNAFGPGIPAQDLELTARMSVDKEWVLISDAVPWSGP